MRLLILFFLSLLGFSGFSYLVFYRPSPMTLDSVAYNFFSSTMDERLIVFFQILSGAGASAFILPLLGIFSLALIYLGKLKIGLWNFLAVTLSMQLNAALKIFFGRPRPHPFGDVLLPDSFAYPSGHALGAFVFYFLMSYVTDRLWPRHRFKNPLKITAIVLVICVGLSRSALGVHWLTDVIGGYLLGAFSVTVALLIGQGWNLWNDQKNPVQTHPV